MKYLYLGTDYACWTVKESDFKVERWF